MSSICMEHLHCSLSVALRGGGGLEQHFRQHLQMNSPTLLPGSFEWVTKPQDGRFYTIAEMFPPLPVAFWSHRASSLLLVSPRCVTSMRQRKQVTESSVNPSSLTSPHQCSLNFAFSSTAVGVSHPGNRILRGCWEPWRRQGE